MTKRVYGNPEPFRGGAHVSGCYRDENGFPMVMVMVNTPDGLHSLHLDAYSWAKLYEEVKQTFEDGPEDEAQAA